MFDLKQLLSGATSCRDDRLCAVDGGSVHAVAPELLTREAAEVYARHLVDAYFAARGGVAAAREFSAVRTAARRSVMLFGRAVGGADVLHRTGLLDSAGFARWYAALTGSFPSAVHLASVRPVETRDQADAHVVARLRVLRARREATVVRGGMTVGEQEAAYRTWLVHLGQVCEVVGLLFRQGLLDEVGYGAHHAAAMGTLLPTVDERHFR